MITGPGEGRVKITMCKQPVTRTLIAARISFQVAPA
jgi:hypothetical protein